MSARRILVTGAGGFLGSHVCRYFSQHGFLVAAVGRLHTGAEGGELPPNLVMGGMTLPDPSFIDLVRSFQPELLVHGAGTASVGASVQEPYQDFKQTVDVCAFTLETVRQHAPGCRFVQLSSASVYGQPARLPVDEEAPCAPLSPYGYHKRMCETLVEEYSQLFGLSVAILRIFSAYGDNLRRQVVFDLCRKLLEGSGPTFDVQGTGQESRDFVHAWDVARVVDHIHAVRATGVFNVGSGSETTIAELVTMLRQELGSEKQARFTQADTPGNPRNWRADIGKLANLGFSPSVTLQEGLRAYCHWYRGAVGPAENVDWGLNPRLVASR